MQPETQIAPGKMIVCANLSQGKAVSGLMGLVRSIPSSQKICVIELPCLNLPQLAYAIGPEHIKDWPKSQSIQQWILDYDVKQNTSIQNYSFVKEGVHYVCVHPETLPDDTLATKVLSPHTLLEVPLFLKHHLQMNFDYIIVLLQGTLVHPMTFFALQAAEGILLFNEDKAHMDYHYKLEQHLISTYQLESHRFAFHVAKEKGVHYLKSVMHRWSSLVHFISELPLKPTFWRSNSVPAEEHPFRTLQGQIYPMDYRYYEFERSLIDREPLEQSLQIERYTPQIQQTSFDFVVEEIAQTNRYSYPQDDLFERVKRYICENGCRPSEELRLRFKCRRNRIVAIIQKLADEGVLTHPNQNGTRTYKLAWSREQVERYLKSSAKIPSVPMTIPGTVPNKLEPVSY